MRAGRPNSCARSESVPDSWDATPRRRSMARHPTTALDVHRERERERERESETHTHRHRNKNTLCESMNSTMSSVTFSDCLVRHSYTDTHQRHTPAVNTHTAAQNGGCEQPSLRRRTAGSAFLTLRTLFLLTAAQNTHKNTLRTAFTRIRRLCRTWLHYFRAVPVKGRFMPKSNRQK